MPAFDRTELGRLIAPHEEPCISLCMPTHARYPESAQDPIKYGNLVRDVSVALERKYGKRNQAASALVERLERLGAEGAEGEGPLDFWRHQKAGLAVFLSPGHFSFYRVPFALRDITVVSGTFHLKPLLPLLHESLRYHLLALTKKEVRLFEGSPHELSQLADHGVPQSITEALGEERSDSRSLVTQHGGSRAGGPVHHASGKGSDVEKDELRRYFREVDKAVTERISKPSGLPLVLAAVDHYHPLYHEVSKNGQLLEVGITQDPNALRADELREAATRLFEPMREARLGRALEEFGAAAARRHGSSDLEEVCSAAAAGRVKRLILEDSRRIWGRLDPETGEVAIGGAAGNPDDADVLDDLAQLAITRGGEVMLAPRDRMPSGTGLAATFRF